jgi:hypothetical protein
VFTSLLFSVIVFFGVQLQGSFFVFAAVYYLTTMTGIVLAYAVTAMVPSVEAASVSPQSLEHDITSHNSLEPALFPARC